MSFPPGFFASLHSSFAFLLAFLAALFDGGRSARSAGFLCLGVRAQDGRTGLTGSIATRRFALYEGDENLVENSTGVLDMNVYELYKKSTR